MKPPLRHILAALLLLPATRAFARDLPYGQAAPAVSSSHGVHTEESAKTKVERRFDKKGQLAEVTFYDYSVEPPQIERLTIQNRDRVRTTERGRLLLRRETESYDAKSGALRTREVESCAQEGCAHLDRKTVLDYSGGKVTVSQFELVDERWKLRTKSEQPSL